MGQNQKKNSRKSNIQQFSETNPHEIFKQFSNYTPGATSIFEISENDIDDIIDNTIKNLKETIPPLWYSNSYITQTNLKPFVRYLLTEWVFSYDSLGSAPFEIKEINVNSTNILTYANLQVAKKTGPNNKPQYFRIHSKESTDMSNPEILETIEYENIDSDFYRYNDLYDKLSEALKNTPHLTTEKRKKEYPDYTLFLQYDHKVYYAYESRKTDFEFCMLDNCRNTLERQYGVDSKDNPLKLQVSYQPNIQCNPLTYNSRFIDYDIWKIKSKYPEIDLKILANLTKVHSFFTERKAQNHGQEIKYYSDCQYLYSMFMKNALTKESSIANKLFAENYTNYNLSTILLDAFLPFLNAFPQTNNKTKATEAEKSNEEYHFSYIQKDLSNIHFMLIESLQANFNKSTLLRDFYVAVEEITKLFLSIKNIGIRLTIAKKFLEDVKNNFSFVKGKSIETRHKILENLDYLYLKLRFTVKVYKEIICISKNLIFNYKPDNMNAEEFAKKLQQIAKQTYNPLFPKLNPDFADKNKLIGIRGKNIAFTNFLYHIIQTKSSYEGNAQATMQGINLCAYISYKSSFEKLNNIIQDLQTNLWTDNTSRINEIRVHFLNEIHKYKNQFTGKKSSGRGSYYPALEICAILSGIEYLLSFQSCFVYKNLPDNTTPIFLNELYYYIYYNMFQKLSSNQLIINTPEYNNDKMRDLFYDLLVTLSSEDNLYSPENYLNNIEKANSKEILIELNLIIFRTKSFKKIKIINPYTFFFEQKISIKNTENDDGC